MLRLGDEASYDLAPLRRDHPSAFAVFFRILPSPGKGSGTLNLERLRTSILDLASFFPAGRHH